MDFDELMKTRYSVRKFQKDRQVPDEMIEPLIEAVCIAPTAENKQPLRMFVIKDGNRLEDIRKVTKYHYSAPLTIAIGYVPEEAWTRDDGRNYGDVDASIAAMQLWLKAEDAGLGAVWVSNFDPKLLRELFPETDGTDIVALMQIGFPDEKSRPAGWHTKKRDRSEIVTII